MGTVALIVAAVGAVVVYIGELIKKHDAALEENRRLKAEVRTAIFDKKVDEALVKATDSLSNYERMLDEYKKSKEDK